MAISSAVLSSRDEPTTVVRVAALTAVSLDGLPRLPSLSGLVVPGPFGGPLSAIQVPGYDVLRELGRGGMGVVYLARHHKLDRHVALKMVIARQYAGQEEQQRFRQEVEAVAKLNHPNIAQVYEVGEHEGFSYAAFEYVDGGTLLQWQKQKPVPPQDAARLAVTLARAVQHAHDNGIIHRDLKPANILLQAGARCEERGTGSNLSLFESSSRLDARSAILDPVPKITDFGLAKKLDQASNLTVTGMACGTPNYMAPEQIQTKHGPVSTASDLYGLGAILFELLTARAPFNGETPLDTMQAVLHDPAPSVRQFRPDTPRDLEVIVAKCLEKDPARRYESARAMAEDLERYLENRPILARGVGPIERGRRWMQRNPYPTALITTLLLGCAITAALALQFWRVARSERHIQSELLRTLTMEQIARGEANAARTQAEAAQRQADFRRQDAESARLTALQSQKDAEQSQQAAEAAARKSDADRLRATRSMAASTKLVDTILEKIATDVVFREDEQLPVRRWIISQSYENLVEIRKQDPTNAELQYRINRAVFFFGEFSTAIGHFDVGMNHFYDAQAAMQRLVKTVPDRADWQLDFARMNLDLVYASYRGHSLPRVSGPHFLGLAIQALDTAATLEDTPSTIEAIRVMRIREKILRAFDANYRFADTHAARTKDAFEAAQSLLDFQNPQRLNRNDVDLYGELILQRAAVAAREGDPAAQCYHDLADNLYENCRNVWFPHNKWTRWDVRWVIAMKAHGLYCESVGATAAARQLLSESQETLVKLVNSGTEIASSREELAETFLATIERNARQDDKFDPLPQIAKIEKLLEPTWVLKNPSDRARDTMARAHRYAALWCGRRLQHREAARHFLQEAADWHHGLDEKQALGLKDRMGHAFAAAAVHQAQSGERAKALFTSEKALAYDPNCGISSYQTARLWSVLAAQATALPDDADTAIVWLKKAEGHGFFEHPEHRKHFETAPEFQSMRRMFSPKAIAAK